MKDLVLDPGCGLCPNLANPGTIFGLSKNDWTRNLDLKHLILGFF
jgi:hypothetical protein